jgi:hypothetical protein
MPDYQELQKINWGLANKGLPSPTSGDNVYGPLRSSRYGELVTQVLEGSKMYAAAREGSYFVATNPTPLTGIAGIAAADGFDDLEALMFLRNGDSNPYEIVPDFLLLECITAVGTNGTNTNFAVKCDKGATRYSSGGSSITPVNASMASTRTSGIDSLKFGALVTTAATSQARLMWHQRLRSVIKVLGDKYLFSFGQSQGPVSSGIPTEGTLQACIQCQLPPIVLGPGDSMLVHEFASSQTVAAQYQFTFGFVVR